MYEDKTLKCKECGQEFVFTAGEQEFYAEKGFQNEPTRCKECRNARKASIATTAAATAARHAVTQERTPPAVRERCSPPSATSAAERLSFLSSLQTTDPYTAASALPL